MILCRACSPAIPVLRSRFLISETVEVYRGDVDRRGNGSKGLVSSVDVVFSWGDASRNSVRGDSADFGPQIFVRSGADLRARDRIQRANGERYAVVGHSMWDSALEVFGDSWMVFEVESVNG